MKFIWFDECASYEDVKKLIKNKNENCSESFGDILHSVIDCFDGLALADLGIEYYNYDYFLESSVYRVFSYRPEFPEVLCYFIEVH